MDRVERSIARLLNAVRAANGRPPLHRDWHLAVAADRHSAMMARGNVLTHSPAITARLSRRHTVGETVAWMPRGTRGIARKVVIAWMRSPEHRAALLDGRFHLIGIARRRGPSGTFVTAELMG